MPATAHETRLGVPPLDRFLPAIPAHTSLVLLNEPGVEVEPFLYQAAASHLDAGGVVVYVVLDRSISSVVKGMRDHGFDPAPAGDRLRFVDGFSSLMGVSEGAPYALTDLKDATKLATVLEVVARDHPAAFVIIDSLSTLIDQAGFRDVRAATPRVLAALRRFPLSVSVVTAWPYEEPLSTITDPFDAVVHLRGVEERVVMSQYFTVERAAWVETTGARPVLFKALKPGGVVAYVPKILVTGPFHAGKSAFIHAVSDTATSVNRLGTTVALDHGHVVLDGLAADIFGTPGQERFDPLLKTVAAQALGVILLVDSTRPDTIPRAKEMMQLTWKHALPILIAANKQDIPGALSPAEIGALMGAPPQVRVAGCTTNEPNSCRQVLTQLIDQILGVAVSR
ncbi:MAG: ADP-ribosylation factor-like protein [Thermoplasmatota archaeon]